MDIEYMDIVIGEFLLSILVANIVLGYWSIRSSMFKWRDGVEAYRGNGPWGVLNRPARKILCQGIQESPTISTYPKSIDKGRVNTTLALESKYSLSILVLDKNYLILFPKASQNGLVKFWLPLCLSFIWLP